MDWMCSNRKKKSSKAPWCVFLRNFNQIRIHSLFKVRGALNAIRGLIPITSEKPKAVVTYSSGNHGQALAYAAQLEGTY